MTYLYILFIENIEKLKREEEDRKASHFRNIKVLEHRYFIFDVLILFILFFSNKHTFLITLNKKKNINNIRTIHNYLMH